MRFDKSACGDGKAPLKPLRQPRSDLMIAIFAIAAFLIVIGALNRYEFGRFD